MTFIIERASHCCAPDGTKPTEHVELTQHGQQYAYYWTAEFATLEDLMAFIAVEGDCVVGINEQHNLNSVLIYDDSLE